MKQTVDQLICPKCGQDFGEVNWVIIDLNAGVQIMITRVPWHKDSTEQRCEAANTPHRKIID